MAFAEANVKQPNVSGQFYTSNPKQLAAQIQEYTQEAQITPLTHHVDILLVPHAGYMYSGPVAAYGFKAVSANKYKTIIILAPSHYYGFDGISIWQEGAFQTPLGTVPVDSAIAQKLIAADENFYFLSQAFDQEHSLEVEIPFLQETFRDFKIVPVIMGQPSFALLEKFAATLKEVIGNRQDVLIVVSSDLSHYHTDAKAREMDMATIEAIRRLDAQSVWKGCQLRSKMEMCGFVPTVAAILYAHQRGLTHAQVLRYGNSGDVTGDKDRVVGYAAMAIYDGDGRPKAASAAAGKEEESGTLTLNQKKHLLAIARQTLETYFQSGKIMEVEETDPRLKQEDGAFVTITKQGHLRGCIGNIIGRGPLYETVRNMAIAAATQDPRFNPVARAELGSIDLEISVLSPPRQIKDVGEIVLGKHGVIVSQGYAQGVFLPQVADETGWSKEEFLSQLCAQKAHLPADAWKDSKTKIEIFTAQVFSEKEFQH